MTSLPGSRWAVGDQLLEWLCLPLLAYLATRTCPYCYSAGLLQTLLVLGVMSLPFLGLATRYRRSTRLSQRLSYVGCWLGLGVAAGMVNVWRYGWGLPSVLGISLAGFSLGLFLSLYYFMRSVNQLNAAAIANTGASAPGSNARALLAQPARPMLRDMGWVLMLVNLMAATLVIRALSYYLRQGAAFPPAFQQRSYQWVLLDCSLILSSCVVFSLLCVRELSQHLTTTLGFFARHLFAVGDGHLDQPLPSFPASEWNELAGGISHMQTGLRERDHIRSLMGKYFSPAVATRIIEQQTPLLEGQERELVLFYSDIFGFTSLAEKTEPRQLVLLLNTHLDLVVSKIQKHGGVIDKFIGDACLAFFDPNLSPGAELAAYTAAREIMETGAGLLPCGIALHTGRVIAGNIGSHERMEFTIIGDPVNTVARIEGQTRILGERLLLSDELARKIHAVDPTVAMRPLGPISLRGKQHDVLLWAGIYAIPPGQ